MNVFFNKFEDWRILVRENILNKVFCMFHSVRRSVRPVNAAGYIGTGTNVFLRED